MKANEWRKSSRSLIESSCVEVMWRTSTQCLGDNSCVEVGFAKVVRRDDVEVRDEPSDVAQEQPVRQ